MLRHHHQNLPSATDSYFQNSFELNPSLDKLYRRWMFLGLTEVCYIFLSNDENTPQRMNDAPITRPDTTSIRNMYHSVARLDLLRPIVFSESEKDSHISIPR